MTALAKDLTAQAKFDLLTRVAGDAPMGQLMRQYWMPVLQSARLEADGAPVRLRILGEDLVAFRATNGRVSLMAERCPHRGVSLALARNEQCGLRCIMHGWKIDVNGKVVEAANLGTKTDLGRIDTGFRPTLESAGLVWAWFGERDAPGPPPAHNFARLPDSHVASVVAMLHCNWLQPLETLWDPYHVTWLHEGSIEKANAANQNAGFFANGLPETEYQATDYGFRYTSKCPNGVIIGTPFVMPWYTHHMLGAAKDEDALALGHVPVDDENTLVWAIIYNRAHPLDPTGNGMRLIDSFPRRFDYRDGYSRENIWAQDRAKMKSGESFSGIGAGLGSFGVFLEDYGAVESMGPIVDRSRDYLAGSDTVIIQARSMLLDALRSFSEGRPAPGAGDEVAAAAASVERLR